MMARAMLVFIFAKDILIIMSCVVMWGLGYLDFKKAITNDLWD
jgi:hypothetical protein